MVVRQRAVAVMRGKGCEEGEKYLGCMWKQRLKGGKDPTSLEKKEKLCKGIK